MTEIRIPNYENYTVSNQGVVTNTRTGRRLKLEKIKVGYLRVTVCKGNTPSRYLVHRLVADLFLDNPEKKPVVNHIDADKTNNRVSNLEWCTTRENQDHAMDLDLCPKGVENGMSKYTEDQVLQVCSLLQRGVNRREIVESTGVSLTSVKDIRRRKTWAWLSLHYNW